MIALTYLLADVNLNGDRIILALLTAGGATFVWTVTKSFIAFKNSAEGREDKAVGRLEKFEANCRAELAYERKWGAWWSRRAAVYERALIANGIDVPPMTEPEPVREDPKS